MTDEKRVVLIKPGDVLLIGGVRFGSAEQGSEAMLRFKELTGITPVVFFADDIQLDALSAEQLAVFTAESQRNHSLTDIERSVDGEKRAHCWCGWIGDWTDEGDARAEHTAHAAAEEPA